MDILELIEKDGFKFAKMASTNNGEYKGPCPWCGGTNRFTIWPHLNEGRYICRQCERLGDAIQYLRDYHDMSYLLACAELGIPYKYTAIKPLTRSETEWTPRQTTTPPLTWQKKADAFLFESYKHLLSAAGKTHRDWLNERGISNDTIKTARLGWNFNSIVFDPESWGLLHETDNYGKLKSVWLPEGLIIPYFKNYKLIRLRTRQENPITDDRYIIVRGSNTSYMRYAEYDESKPCMIVESELDGWLCHSAAGDLVNVYATGSAQTRPDEETHKQLSNAAILLSLDLDSAGIESAKWWQKHYPDSIEWPCPAGKDPGEGFQERVNIREWIAAGIAKLKRLKPSIRPKIVSYETPTPTPDQSADNPAEESGQPQPAQSDPPARPEEDHPLDTAMVIPFQTENTKDKICMHGKGCAHLSWHTTSDPPLSRLVCLIDRNSDNPVKASSIYMMDRCPREFWKTYKDSPAVTTIITY